MRAFEPQPEMVLEEMTQSISMVLIHYRIIDGTEKATILRCARHLDLLKEQLELLPIFEAKSRASSAFEGRLW